MWSGLSAALDVLVRLRAILFAGLAARLIKYRQQQISPSPLGVSRAFLSEFGLTFWSKLNAGQLQQLADEVIESAMTAFEGSADRSRASDQYGPWRV
jgi:hypothetical protein